MRLLPLLATVCCLTVVGCGKHSTTTSSDNSDADNIVPGSDGIHDGSEGPIYTVAHPNTCGTCSTAAVTTVQGCPNIMGQPATCEGECFIEDSLQPTYHNDPPSSGPMYDSPDWTWYESTTPIQRGTYMRDLAHGFVVALYNCPNGCDPELETIRTALNNEPGWPWQLTQDPQFNVQGNRFALVSWTWQYVFDLPDSAGIDCFVQQHAWQGYVEPEGN